MLKQLQLIGTTVLLVAASVVGCVYLWWQSTPQYALLEARRGYIDKDKRKFNKYLDVATFTNEFTDEIIFDPAEETPNLSRVQRVIGIGAIKASRPRITNSLIFQIQNLVRKEDGKIGGTAYGATLPTNGVHEPGTADGAESKLKVVEPPPKFTSLLREGWKREKQRLKQATLDRMTEYAKKHPEALVNKIFAAPQGHRATTVKEIIAECGFIGKNFRTYHLESRGPKYIAHLSFFSPRIQDVVTVRFELEHLHEGPFGRYRVAQLVNFKDTLRELRYDTDQEIQNLVRYGLADLSKQTLASTAKDLFKSIGKKTEKLNDTKEDDYDDDDDNVD